MKEIYCSTGALLGHPNGRNYRLLAEFAEKLDCDGFEFMVYSSWYPELDELIRTVKAMKLHIPVIHCQKALSEQLAGMETLFSDEQFVSRTFSAEEDAAKYQNAIREFEQNLRVANEFGADRMVFHLWNGLVSDKNLDRNIERFGVLKEMAEKAGILLMPENVICNTRDPLSDLMQVHRAYPDACFVYDTKMAEFHGQTFDLFSPEYEELLLGGHIRHLHINDYGGGIKDWGNLGVLPIGKGHVDFRRFFDSLSGYDYAGDFTVEATAFHKGSPDVDFAMLNRCFADLRKLAETPVLREIRSGY